MKGMMRFAASAFVASILTFSARAAEVLAEPLAAEEMTSAIVWVGETATGGLYLWSTAKNWLGNVVPGESATVQIASGKNKPTVNANATVSKVELVGDVALDVAEGAILQADFLGWSGEATGTLSLGGAGKLLLRANSTFSYKVMSGGALSVASGATFATTLNSGDPNIENVTLTFDNGAKWQSHGWLGLLGTVTVNNAGELTFAAYSWADPSIKGTGKLVKKGAGALSLYGKGGTHETAVDVAEGELKLLGGKTFTGAITGSGALTVGSGESEEITFSGTFGTVAQGETSATYTGNLTLASGVKLTLSADTPTVIQNTVKGSGLLKVGKGSVTLKGKDNEVSSEVASGATLVLDTVKGANIDTNKTFKDDNENKNCRTVTNNGTLELRSGFGYFYIAGSGTTKVPGKDFLFGVSGVNSANAPLANNLTIAPDATLSIRSWANKEMSVGKLSSEGSINREGGGSGYLPSMTISGAVDKLGNLGDNVSVKLAANSTLGTVTGGTATYERDIAIGAGSTLIFSSSTPTVLKGKQVSGAGSLTIAGGSFTFGAGARGTYKGKTTVEKDATLVLANGDDTLSAEKEDAALVTIDGVLIGGKKGSNKTTTYYRKTAGSGTIQVPEGETFVIGQDYESGTTGLTKFTGTLEIGGTFEARMWQSRTYTLSGLNVKFTSKSGALTGGEKGTAKLNLSTGTTLSGSGKVKIPVTFDGGVLDASAGGDALTLEKAVTCTGKNKVKVKLADSPLGKVFLITSEGVLDRLLLALDSASEALAGTVFVETVVGSTHSFSLMKKPTMEGMPEAVTGNGEVMNKIYGALSQVSGVEKLTGVELWNTAGTVSEKTNLADVLTLFDGVAPWVKPDEQDKAAGKVVVMYDFGVSDLTVMKVGDVMKVLVCAKVANSSSASFNSATYADGTTVSLILTKVVKGVDEQGNATSTTTPTSYTKPLTESELAAVGLTAVTGELWFAVPMTDLASGTNNFTVEASK